MLGYTYYLYGSYSNRLFQKFYPFFKPLNFQIIDLFLQRKVIVVCFQKLILDITIIPFIVETHLIHISFHRIHLKPTFSILKRFN